MRARMLFRMTILAKSFEDTAVVHARRAGRSIGARTLAALGRVSEPHQLFPFLALLILSVLWLATFRAIKVENAAAQRAAAASARDVLETYEAQVVRALREIDQTLKVVQYAAETKGPRLALTDLQRRSLLPPNLLFVVSLVDARGAVVASTDAANLASLASRADVAGLHDRAVASNQELSVGRPQRDPRSGEWRLRSTAEIAAS